MSKTYPTIEEQSQTLAEQTGLRTESVNSHATHVASSSPCDQVIASTMSVDEYFDGLIEKVRHDYASL